MLIIISIIITNRILCEDFLGSPKTKCPSGFPCPSLTSVPSNVAVDRQKQRLVCCDAGALGLVTVCVCVCSSESRLRFGNVDLDAVGALGC